MQTGLYMLYSSIVPGNLPSQLEILSTGQNYCETGLSPSNDMHVHFDS